jgi:hypothetical protein
MSSKRRKPDKSVWLSLWIWGKLLVNFARGARLGVTSGLEVSAVTEVPAFSNPDAMKFVHGEAVS